MGGPLVELLLPGRAPMRKAPLRERAQHQGTAMILGNALPSHANSSSSIQATSTIPISSSTTDTTSSHSSTTVTTSTSTTESFSTIKPTATPGVGDTPRFPIYIGEGEGDDGENFRLAFVVDGTSTAACNYGFIPASTEVNPCGRPFLLADGFEYMWNGCGGDTWATWRNPSSRDTEYRMLHEGPCEYVEQSFNCDGTLVHGDWLCRNSTG